MSWMTPRAFLGAGLAVIAAAGCGSGPGSRNTGAYPKPGETQVISVDPVRASGAAGDNLIRNGNFNEWWAGTPIPSGFSAPADGAGSSITRIKSVRTGGVNAVEQTWTAWETSLAPENLFRTLVTNLSKDTVYELSVTGVALSPSSVSISVLDPVSETKFPGGCLSLLEIEPREKELQELTGFFQPAKDGDVLICAHANDETRPDTRVQWVEWKLSPSSMPAPESMRPWAKPLMHGIGVMPKPFDYAALEKAGDEPLYAGWIATESDTRVMCAVGDLDFEAEYGVRPDIDQKFAEYPVRKGWTIHLPPGLPPPPVDFEIFARNNTRYSITLVGPITLKAPNKTK